MIIEKTKDSPYVYLSASEYKFEIKGNSYYIEITDLYDKILNWIDKEIPNLNCDMNWIFHFGVISSASLKSIIEIFNKLYYFYKEGKKIRITWIYDKDDVDNLEIANDFLDFTNMPVDVIERY